MPATSVGSVSPPKMQPVDVRQTLNMVLPMPRLKVLRLSVAANLLDALGPQLYESITDVLPALEKLWLGHADSFLQARSSVRRYHETVSLHRLTAFRIMLPIIVEASVETVDGLTLEENPRVEWAVSTLNH